MYDCSCLSVERVGRVRESKRVGVMVVSVEQKGLGLGINFNNLHVKETFVLFRHN